MADEVERESHSLDSRDLLMSFHKIVSAQAMTGRWQKWEREY